MLSYTGSTSGYSSAIPFNPASNIQANARYGLAAGSTFLISVLVAFLRTAGILIIELRLASLQHM